MRSSIAHTNLAPGSKPAAEIERDDLRDLLRTVLEALDMPFDARRDALLNMRVISVVGTLRDVLGGKATNGIPWETDYLRKDIAGQGALEDGGHA
ncbi:hypothetical protein ABT124_03220 [Streptomyces sp. NPDC001982]|uniref:hypothetical protein n=1 Tax=Streptomyces sp. NPDC001982 TaxID=3154405 RepID=UPI0033331695